MAGNFSLSEYHHIRIFSASKYSYSFRFYMCPVYILLNAFPKHVACPVCHSAALLCNTFTSVTVIVSVGHSQAALGLVDVLLCDIFHIFYQ